MKGRCIIPIMLCAALTACAAGEGDAVETFHTTTAATSVSETDISEKVTEFEYPPEESEAYEPPKAQGISCQPHIWLVLSEDGNTVHYEKDYSQFVEWSGDAYLHPEYGLDDPDSVSWIMFPEVSGGYEENADNTGGIVLASASELISAGEIFHGEYDLLSADENSVTFLECLTVPAKDGEENDKAIYKVFTVFPNGTAEERRFGDMSLTAAAVLDAYNKALAEGRDTASIWWNGQADMWTSEPDEGSCLSLSVDMGAGYFAYCSAASYWMEHIFSDRYILGDLFRADSESRSCSASVSYEYEEGDPLMDSTLMFIFTDGAVSETDGKIAVGS